MFGHAQHHQVVGADGDRVAGLFAAQCLCRKKGALHIGVRQNSLLWRQLLGSSRQPLGCLQRQAHFFGHFFKCCAVFFQFLTQQAGIAGKVLFQAFLHEIAFNLLANFLQRRHIGRLNVI